MNKFYYTFFTPLKRKKTLCRTIRMMTFDTETKDGLNGTKLFIAGVCWRARELLHVRQFRSQRALVQFLRSLQHKTVIYSHNLYFDLRFILQREMLDKIYADDKKCASGGNVIQYRLTKYVTLRDSLQFIKTSQDDAEKDWGVPESLRKIDCKHIFAKNFANWSDGEKKLVRTHNRNDVQSLFLIMQKFREEVFNLVGLDAITKCSMATLGLSAARTFLPQKYNNWNVEYETEARVYSLSNIHDDVREAYYGGRTEVVRRPNAADQKTGFGYLDFNSLYPAMMFEAIYPTGKPTKYTDGELNQAELWDLIQNFEGIARVNVECPENVYPLLPVRIKPKLLFPTGHWEASYTFLEIREAQKLGYIILHIDYAICYFETCRPFQKFVETLNAAKIAADCNKSKRLAIKYLLNPPSGKLGQNPVRQVTRHAVVESIDDNPEGVTRETDFGLMCTWKETQVKPKPFMFPEWAAYVLGNARLRLYEVFKRLEFSQYYFDTDGVVFPLPFINAVATLMDDKKLGYLKREDEFIEWFYPFAPKCYAYRAGGITHIKHKGLPRSIREKLEKTCVTLEDYQKMMLQTFVIDSRYETWGRAMKKGRILMPRGARHIKFKCVDTKREWIDEFTSKALSLPLPSTQKQFDKFAGVLENDRMAALEEDEGFGYWDERYADTTLTTHEQKQQKKDYWKNFIND